MTLRIYEVAGSVPSSSLRIFEVSAAVEVPTATLRIYEVAASVVRPTATLRLYEIAAVVPRVHPIPATIVEALQTASLTATSTNPGTTFTFSTTGVTLATSGATTSFTAPATLSGQTVTVAVKATVGSVSSGVTNWVVTVLPHNLWQARGGTLVAAHLPVPSP